MIFKRGRIFNASDGRKYVYMGWGPHAYEQYHTMMLVHIPEVDWLLPTTLNTSFKDLGDTYLVREGCLTSGDYGGWHGDMTAAAIRRCAQGQRFEQIPEAECPECDMEMIFYSEDYICAWCREMLEDG